MPANKLNIIRENGDEAVQVRTLKSHVFWRS
jgi:hypothetical protein